MPTKFGCQKSLATHNQIILLHLNTHYFVALHGPLQHLGLDSIAYFCPEAFPYKWLQRTLIDSAFLLQLWRFWHTFAIAHNMLVAHLSFVAFKCPTMEVKEKVFFPGNIFLFCFGGIKFYKIICIFSFWGNWSYDGLLNRHVSLSTLQLGGQQLLC